MIVMMAGLPGTGKSTLARALAERTSGAVLDKDEIRRALFPPADIEYSTGQDDFVMEVMLKTAGYLLRKDPARYVFLDGRPFSQRYQLERVMEHAKELGQEWRIVECVCSEETARRRIEEQGHPAGNRDFALYLRVKARFEEIDFPKLVVDTERPLDECAELALASL
ncbi:MAG TPA: ATP-binding protein [Terriglobales bacterium]|nr:ATP-binding protein [Terriglobales bacterium]